MGHGSAFARHDPHPLPYPYVHPLVGADRREIDADGVLPHGGALLAREPRLRVAGFPSLSQSSDESEFYSAGHQGCVSCLLRPARESRSHRCASRRVAENGTHSTRNGQSAMKVRNAVAKILKAQGIEAVFTFPTNPLLEGMAEEGIRIITARTERHAIHMADGLYRARQA